MEQSQISFYTAWTTEDFLDTFAKLRKVTISFVMSVSPPVCLSAWNSSAPTGQIFIKFDI